jgi:hypothetical protein
MTVDEVYKKMGWVQRPPREIQKLRGILTISPEQRDRQTGRTTKMLAQAVSLLSENVPVCVVMSWPQRRVFAMAQIQEMLARCDLERAAIRLNVVALEQEYEVRNWGGCVLLDHACREVRSIGLRHMYERISERATYCPNACAEFCR